MQTLRKWANIAGVTEHLRCKIIENGGDPEREVLNLIPAKDEKHI